MGDMVSKCLGKTPKTKRPKIETMLKFDDEIGQWVIEDMEPTIEKSIEEIQPQDYVAEKTILGLASRATDMRTWNVGNTRIS